MDQETHECLIQNKLTLVWIMNTSLLSNFQLLMCDSNQSYVWFKSWHECENQDLLIEVWFKSHDCLIQIRYELDSSHMKSLFESCLDLKFWNSSLIARFESWNSLIRITWLESKVKNMSFIFLIQIILSFNLNHHNVELLICCNLLVLACCSWFWKRCCEWGSDWRYVYLCKQKCWWWCGWNLLW